MGKTTLCRLLEREWGARLILEPNETNPFLEPFYRDPERFAFPAQMAYMLQRWRQQSRLRQGELFTQLVVSDYVWEKDRMFAEKTLPADELALYDRFAEALAESGPSPDLLVWLDCDPQVCMGRIAKRRAPGEDVIELDYLEDLNQRYQALLARWTQSPVLRLDARKRNLADDLDAQQVVLHRIRRALDGHLEDDPMHGEPTLFPGR